MKKKHFSVSLVVVFIVGFLIGAIGMSLSTPQNQELVNVEVEKVEEHEHVTKVPHEHEGESMKHETIEVQSNVPKVDLIIHNDPIRGWNLELQTENFKFMPRNAGLDDRIGEGHAHLYIDDIKITRLYSNWFHLPELTIGEHEIKVILNTNNHKNYVVGGELVSSSQTILVN